jgi:polysaccharide deacetylase 2 family uncharacterized protein YibQ
LRAEEIHRITRAFVTAANSVVPQDSEVRSEIGAFDRLPNSADHVEIRLLSKRVGSAYPSSVVTLLQVLGNVATSHGLTQDPQSEDSDAIFLNYRHAGIVTHTVHIHFREATESRKSDVPAGPDHGGPARLAIILDDLGNDRAAAEAVFAMPYPLTVSILPNHVHSVEIAELAHRRGDEVMLHLPMQSLGKERPEAQEVHAGMAASELSALVSEFLGKVPGAVGVNNHQGSESTADKKLMTALMPILRKRKLFYVDSRTSATTVAYDTAQQFGVRAGFRNVPFLDDVEEVAAVRAQIKLAIDGAAKKKEAIAIGHAHRVTLEALKEALPQAKNQGVRLVFASELVR